MLHYKYDIYGYYLTIVMMTTTSVTQIQLSNTLATHPRVQTLHIILNSAKICQIVTKYCVMPEINKE